jgi:hypothetical protein
MTMTMPHQHGMAMMNALGQYPPAAAFPMQPGQQPMTASTMQTYYAANQQPGYF